MSLLQCRQLCVHIADRRVCDGLHLTVEGGETWGVLGMNGAGKTTLLLTLCGLRSAQPGDIEIDGRPLAAWQGRKLARVRGYMAQDTHDAFPLTTLEAALVGRHPHQPAWAWESPEDIVIARAALRRVGLSGMEGRDCTSLSGGERRRLALAALLAQQPQLYLLDEPTTHLDPHHQIALLDLLAEERAAGKAIVMSLHDPNLATRYCSHVLLLFGDGEFACGPAPDLLTAENLSRLYRHPVRAHQTSDGVCFLVG